MKADEIVDFAVVGGGVAGCYAAWRVASALADEAVADETRQALGVDRQKVRIRLFEADTQVGGRLLSEQLPGLPFQAELGGMRYTDRQLLFKALIKQLGCASDVFDFGKVYYYLRGRRWPPTGAHPYILRPECLNETGEVPEPDLLVRGAMRQALLDMECSDDATADEAARLREILARIAAQPDLSAALLSTAEWSLIKRRAMIQERPLYAVGLWNLLHYYLGGEGFSFAHDAFGYESILLNWNAAEAIPWFLRDFDTRYKALRAPTPMDWIVGRLRSNLDQLCPGAVQTNHTLRRLVFNGPGNPITLILDTVVEGTKRHMELRARNVILALPKAALREIFPGDPVRRVLDEEAAQRWGGFDFEECRTLDVAIDSVESHTLFKLFIGYERAWWSDPRLLGRASGRAVTDLPIRQVYFFGPEKALEETEAGMVMASYSDARYVDFWRPLGSRPAAFVDDVRFYGGDREQLGSDAQKVLRYHGVTRPMVRKAHRQVCELLGADEAIVPEAIVALAKEWREGWHTWNPHFQPWREMKIMRRPFSAARLHICGEAYSPEQGWVEGALRSAEQALAEVGVRPPGWISGCNWHQERCADLPEYIGWE